MTTLDAGPRARAIRGIAPLLRMLRTWPWEATLRTLGQRFRDDRLGLSAGSLTFTTLIALVPLLTVMLAVFTAFPIFSTFQGALEKYFLQTLVPETIARPVLRALTQFAGQASRLGSVGLLLLGCTALSMMLTIDRTLNAIWHVRRPRPFAQRVLIYWAALTLGPLVLGVSLSMTSYAITASRGLVGVLPGGVALLLNLVQFGLFTAAIAGLFYFVPNTAVSPRHAWAGALFVAVGIELAKRALAWYVGSVASLSAVYGALFATVPILLLWIYLAWLIVLFGAVITAYAPSLAMHVDYRPQTPGLPFELALAALRLLARARAEPPHGLTLPGLSQAVQADPLTLEPLLEFLVGLDWIARIAETGPARYVLLGDPARRPAQPLVDALLLAPGPATRLFRQKAGVDALTLAELLE